MGLRYLDKAEPFFKAGGSVNFQDLDLGFLQRINWAYSPESRKMHLMFCG